MVKCAMKSIYNDHSRSNSEQSKPNAWRSTCNCAHDDSSSGTMVQFRGTEVQKHAAPPQRMPEDFRRTVAPVAPVLPTSWHDDVKSLSARNCGRVETHLASLRMYELGRHHHREQTER